MEIVTPTTSITLLSTFIDKNQIQKTCSGVEIISGEKSKLTSTHSWSKGYPKARIQTVSSILWSNF